MPTEKSKRDMATNQISFIYKNINNNNVFNLVS